MGAYTGCVFHNFLATRRIQVLMIWFIKVEVLFKPTDALSLLCYECMYINPRLTLETYIIISIHF